MKNKFKKNCVRIVFSLLMATSASQGMDDSNAVNEPYGSNKQPIILEDTIILDNKLHPIGLDDNLGKPEEKKKQERDIVYEEMCRIDEYMDKEFGYYFGQKKQNISTNEQK